jgi:hypothetical protein
MHQKIAKAAVLHRRGTAGWQKTTIQNEHVLKLKKSNHAPKSTLDGWVKCDSQILKIIKVHSV